MSSLKLYTRNKNPVRTLSSGIDYKELQINYDHTAPDETMSFTILGPKVPEDIEPEGYIETESQIYVIKEISDHQITAQLCLEELEAYTLDTFTAVDQTITAAASAALKGTGWTAKSSISRVRSVQTFKKQPLEVIKKIRDAWMCEMQFDTKNRTVIFGETIGKDRGTYFIRGVNLKEASESRDSYDFYTRIQPIGKDGLTIAEVNNGSEYIENHQYSEKNRTLVWEDTSYEDPQALMEDAEKKLADMSQPKKSYKASVKDLSRIHQETDDEPLQDELDVALKDEISELLYDRSIYADFDFSPGDMVYIVSRPDGIRDKQRVVKMTVYPDAPEKNEIELANTVLTFEELQSKMQAAADAWEDVSDSDGTINGVYVHGIQAGEVVGIEVRINGQVVASDYDLSTLDINGTNNSLIALINQSAQGTQNATPKKLIRRAPAAVETNKLDGKILKAQSVKAESIDVDDLFAQNINASGTITGAKFVGATGSFSGDVVSKTLQANEEIHLTGMDAAGLAFNLPVIKHSSASNYEDEQIDMGFDDGSSSSPKFVFHKVRQGDGYIESKGALYATVSEPSDERLKEHIRDPDVRDALGIINKIKLHAFDWRADGHHQKIGMIAQELEKLDPDMVKDGAYKGVSEFYLIGYLVKAVQQLSEEVKELKDEYQRKAGRHTDVRR